MSMTEIQESKVQEPEMKMLRWSMGLIRKTSSRITSVKRGVWVGVEREP